MGLTREQFDIISNHYNNKRLNNRIKLDNRVKEVYDNIPELKELDIESSMLATNAAKAAIMGNMEPKESLASDMAILREKKKALLLANSYPADYLDAIYDCPLCQDTGYIKGKPCQCLSKEITSLLYSNSMIDDVLQRENFDTFDFDLYSENFIDKDSGTSALDNIEAVVDYCRYFIKNFDKEYDNLLFYGPAGSGKTFLINCIAKELIEKEKSVIYLSAVAFFDLLSKHTFQKAGHNTSTTVTMNEIMTADLLIIDDLGSEMSNSFTDSALFDCLNQRLIRQKSTVISTNLSLEMLNSSYSDRIFSRIIGEYSVFKIFGDDIRIKKKLSN